MNKRIALTLLMSIVITALLIAFFVTCITIAISFSGIG